MERSKLIITLLVSVITFAGCQKEKDGSLINVSWISSTETATWKEQSAISMHEHIGGVADIEILTTQSLQTIDGWGGCFNELGWDAINTLDKKGREEVLANLFDTAKGLRLNFCRLPVGANDYARNWYSFNETNGDFEMKNFSIERDKQVLIPYIHQALQYNKDIRFWASPWSPPTWMKTNKHYANKVGDYNNLKPSQEVPTGKDQFIQDQRYLNAYALYLSKYIEAYKKEGIAISVLQFQNEPFTFNQWPNCSWTAPAISNFIANYLGPAFEEKKLPTELWLGTENTWDMKVFDAVLGNPASSKYIKGVGLQWEGREIIKALHKKYPAFKLMQTETECGEGEFSWKDAEHTFSLVKKYLDGGANSYMYWNMVLKNKGTSSWGWNQNAMIRINSVSKKIIYTPEFYAFKHFSHFVDKGAVCLQLRGTYTDLLAFKNPNGKIIIVAGNPEDTEQQITFKIDDKYFTAQLKAHSFNTFSIK